MLPTIPVDLQQFIAQEVACGKFRTPDEAVVEGLRLLQERERKRDLLRQDLRIATDQLERGEGIFIADEAAHRKLLDDIIQGCESKLVAKKSDI